MVPTTVTLPSHFGQVWRQRQWDISRLPFFGLCFRDTCKLFFWGILKTFHRTKHETFLDWSLKPKHPWRRAKHNDVWGASWKPWCSAPSSRTLGALLSEGEHAAGSKSPELHKHTRWIKFPSITLEYHLYLGSSDEMWFTLKTNIP